MTKILGKESEPATAFATIHATYHTTLQKSPGQLVFGRDMIFNVQLVTSYVLGQSFTKELLVNYRMLVLVGCFNISTEVFVYLLCKGAWT
jgi:hypothetical protein